MDPITGYLINLIIGLVISAASTLLKQAFSKPADAQKQATGTRGSAQIGGKVPQYFLIGTVGEAGKLEYRNAWGNDGEVPNAYLVNVHSFGDLPISAMTKLYANGTVEPISGSGHVTQGYPATGDKAGNLWVEFFDGTQVTASSYLTDKFGADADRPWLSDMIGVGVPYMITTALWSETLWTGFPSFVGEFQGIKLYDPRADTTAGGSGSQRWADPSTWAFSDNNMVMIYNIERGIYYDGARMWGGSATEAQFPYDVWAAAMDACDELVTLDAGGTEKRFRAGRRISLNERPADVIKELLIGCNGRIAHASDGMIYALVGLPEAPDFSFTDADVLASEPLGSIPFPNLDEIINGATATYREPLQAWEDKETAPYLRSDLEAEDDGRQRLEGLDLGTTFSGTQAQRVIKAVIEEGRRFRTHVPAMPPEFAQFRPLQVGAWTSDRYGYVAKWFLITARTRSPWGQVVFGLQEIDPADHDWTPGTDEQPLSFAPVVTNRPAPQAVSGFSLAPVTEVDGASNVRRVGYDAFWSAPSVAVDVQFVRIAHRLVGGTLPIWVGLIPLPDLLAGEGRVTDGTVPGETHEVEIQYLAGSGRETLSSGWLEVEVPALPELSLSVVEDLKWLSEGVRTALDNFEQIGSLISQQDLANFNDRQVLTRELRKKIGDVEASFIEIIEVAVGPGSAIATSLSQLYAAMGGNTAEVNVRWEASAGPTGYGARYGLTAAVNDVTYRSASFLMDVPTDPGDPTRVILDADQIVVSSDGGATVAALFQSGTTFLADARIKDASITAAKIVDATITNAKIADATITGAKIANATIGTAQIGAAAITSAKIGDLEVGTIKLADGAVTSTQSDTAADAALPVDTARSTVVVVAGVTAGAVVQISCGLSVLPSAGTGSRWDLRIYRGATLVRSLVTYSDDVDPVTGRLYLSIAFLDVAPSSGSFTYTASILPFFNGGNVYDFVLVSGYAKK